MRLLPEQAAACPITVLKGAERPFRKRLPSDVLNTWGI